MKRKPKPRRVERSPVTRGGGPVAPGDDEPIEEQPDRSEEQSPDGAQRLGAAEATRAAQTDFERAVEHKVGSIETAPQAEPENGAVGFVEPASDGIGEEPLPPHLLEEWLQPASADALSSLNPRHGAMSQGSA
jgi:hypothetical protein